MSAEYGVSTEQISDIRKNKKGIFLNLSIIRKFDSQLKNWLNSSLTTVLISLENTCKPHVFDHISKPHLVFICLLTENQYSWSDRNKLNTKTILKFN